MDEPKVVRFEPYFLMWNSTLFYPNPENTEAAKKILYNHSGDGGTIPCWQHKTCGALLKVTDKAPPRLCPHCKADTALEQKLREARGESQGDPREAMSAVS